MQNPGHEKLSKGEKRGLLDFVVNGAPIPPWIALEVWSRDKEQGADRQSSVECSEVSASLNI